MARTIKEIKQSIVDAKTADPTLNTALSSDSNASVWGLWAYITAVAIWTLEVLFDKLIDQVNTSLSVMKPHTLQWYAEKAKSFQFGCSLAFDSDGYDNTALTDDQVAESKIVTYAAAIEVSNKVRIKAAKTVNNSLAALNAIELAALTGYMNLVRDAGVQLLVTSGNADRLSANLTIYYDALVLDGNGKRLDGTDDTPVQTAIDAFLDALPFNGLFVVNRFVAAIEAVPGVIICRPANGSVQATYGTFPFSDVPVEYMPDSGYLSLADNDLTIIYIPHATI